MNRKARVACVLTLSATLICIFVSAATAGSSVTPYGGQSYVQQVVASDPVCNLKLQKLCQVAWPAVCTRKIVAVSLSYVGPDIVGPTTVEIEPEQGTTVVYNLIDLATGMVLSMVSQNGWSIDSRAAGGTDLGDKTTIRINGVDEVIRTSCSTPFVVGAPAPLDPAGDPSPNWLVESFDDRHPLDECTYAPDLTGNEVRYSYHVTNFGGTLTGAVLTDDPLGHVAGPFDLQSGESRVFDVVTEVNATITNVGTVSGYLANGYVCEAEDTATVWVNNVPPSIDAITAPTEPVGISAQPVSVWVSFSDPDTDDTHDVTWEWGDETTDTETGATSPAELSHIYAEAGVYRIQVTVTDDDGGTAAQNYEFIVIYDASAGFVTGGGWIDSPEGAYAGDPTLAGKASFGIVSKYKRGATAPTGETEFQFRAGDLNLHSSSYDWLVVTGRGYAMFKGSGTINGKLAPNGEAYRFRVWAGDDNPDTFRIEIWWEDGDIEYVVYDNGMDQPIGGGSIVVRVN